uniref:hypothetical protein n=1 Tax=Glycomyces salinus TaxID=980294 RepID=UPI0018EC383F
MARSVNPAERTEKARAIHTGLDDAAALINAAHARVLSGVIEAQAWKIHRDVDGFSALRDWLVSKFDFHHKTAADLAAIARQSRKFRVLTEAAVSGAARIDQVAFASRALSRTAAMRLYATTPYRKPVASPYDPEVQCVTPEDLIAQYSIHAPHADLARLLGEIEAALKDQEELLEGLSEQSLARLEVWETENGMWAVDGLLASDTGALLAKLLTTAVAPPRQDDCEVEQTDSSTGNDGTDTAAETETVLPPQAGRNAEALHQMIASFGDDPAAPTRHGHTATLHLVC